jgi:REP element-mobilizing transposase RayT
MKGYNYSLDGMYFITICVKNRKEYFGRIKNNKMEYNKYGDVILKYWQAIPNYYKNASLDEWVIMPNHIHGIIIINNDFINVPVRAEQCSAQNSNPVGTEHYSIAESVGAEQCSAPTGTDIKINYGLLSKIIKSFKEISLKTIRKNYNDYEFGWQRSFYDHIIRNEKSLLKIRKYIYYNPAKWELDRNNPENLLM